ncbi:MAG: TIGR02452 family protein [Acidobacteriota bacterium]
MSLKGVAQETLHILDEGRYISNSGNIVELLSEQRAAVAATILYTPEQAYGLVNKQGAADSIQLPIIEVTDETTQEAARRLVQTEKCKDLLLLNYASARNPGGGFINGAKAQEEDLCRCSGLYPCLLTQPLYYEANRAQSSLLYTDHIIYSPKVPWFRTKKLEFLESFFLASVITAPAPNAGEAVRINKNIWPKIEEVLRRRASLILAIAREHGHRTLLLGAWGCGVFRNQPSMVADTFGNWLASPHFQSYFDRVVFAVYDPSKQKSTLQAFQTRFQTNSTDYYSR